MKTPRNLETKRHFADTYTTSYSQFVILFWLYPILPLKHRLNVQKDLGNDRQGD